MTNIELYHHGIKGQKWGVRRYQNPDGSLTLAGRRHVKTNTKAAKKIFNEIYKDTSQKVSLNYRKQNKLNLKIDKALSKGNVDKADKLRKKADEYGYRGRYWTKNRDLAKQMLDDIDSGKLKAGRDYSAEYKTYVIPMGSVIAIRKKRSFKMYTESEKEALRLKGKLIE